MEDVEWVREDAKVRRVRSAPVIIPPIFLPFFVRFTPLPFPPFFSPSLPASTFGLGR